MAAMRTSLYSIIQVQINMPHYCLVLTIVWLYSNYCMVVLMQPIHNVSVLTRSHYKHLYYEKEVHPAF